MEPDESVLKMYLLGELDEERAAWVSRCLAQNPALVDTLESLARSDTLLAALRGARAAPPDSAQVEAFIDRMKGLAGASNATEPTRQPSAVSTDSGAAAPPADTERATASATGVPKLKGYKVLRLIGSGGMGMVFEAADEKLDRRVALKVMKPEIAADGHARARFVREAKAVACIEHDHVVPIFHINEDGCPFLAMPFLKGEPLDKYLQRSVFVPLHEVLKIGREAALGLAAIHAQGLIHRDIKPGNLWLERFGDDGTWRVKIIDFGLARSHTGGDEPITHAGGVVGTPAYMAPEQARGGTIDARADLFSLGSTLYLLTTGRPPFGSGSVMSVLTALAVQTPTPVRELNPAVPEALADLIEDLLEKNPKDRPANAKAVAEAIRAIEATVKSPLVVLPVGEAAAEPEWVEATSSDRGAKPPRRFRAALLVAVVGALVLLLGGVFVAYKLVFETHSGQIVVEINDPEVETRFKNGELHIFDKQGERKYTLKPSERNKEAPIGEYRVRVEGADGVRLETDEFKIVKGKDTIIRVVAKPLPPGKGPNAPPAQPVAPGPARPGAPLAPVLPPSAELSALRREQVPPDVLAAAGRGDPGIVPEGLVGVLGVPKPMHREAVLGVAYSPNGRWLASASVDKTIILYDAETGIAKRTLLGHTGGVFAIAFTKDNKTLVSAGLDGTVRLWPVDADEKPEVVETGLGPTVWMSMALSRDDKWLAAGNDSGTIRLWRFGDWKRPADITDLEKKVALRALAFSPDGELLAAGGVNHTAAPADAFVFRTDTRKLDSTWPTECRGVLSLKFSRDCKKLATGGGPGNPRGMARIWDLETKKLLFDVQQFRDYTHALDLDPDADHLVVCNGDAGVALFDTATQKQVGYYSGWFGVARSVAYSPDGSSVAFGTQDGGFLVTDAQLTAQKYLDRGSRHQVYALAVKPDGTSVVLSTPENVLYRIDLADPRKSRVVAQHLRAPKSVAWAPDGSKYAVAVGTYYWEADTISVYDSATDKLLYSAKPQGCVISLSFAPDGKMLMASGSFNTTVLFDAATGAELHHTPRKEPSEVTHAFAPDSKSVALCDKFAKRITLLNPATGNEIRSWDTGLVSVSRACAYDPRGQYLAVGETNHTITLWDVQSGKLVRSLSGHTGGLVTLAFSADGEKLVSTARDGTLRVWNPEEARVKKVIPVGPENQHLTFALDRSGQYAFVAGHGGLVYVLKLP